MRMLQSSWFIALVGCLSYMGTTLALVKPSNFAGVHPHEQEEEQVKSPDNSPSWRFINPELDQWMTELRREKEAIALREQQLGEWQSRLAAEQQEINAVTQTVARLQAEFDKNVVRFKTQEIENQKQQIKILTDMSPEGAAAMLNQMSDDEALRIIATMRSAQSGPILEAFGNMGKDQARRAAGLLDRMRKVLPPQGRGTPTS